MCREGSKLETNACVYTCMHCASYSHLGWVLKQEAEGLFKWLMLNMYWNRNILRNNVHFMLFTNALSNGYIIIHWRNLKTFFSGTMPRVCPQIQSCQFIFIPSFIFSLWKLNLIYFLFLGIMNIRIKEFGINFHRDGKIPHHCGFLVSHSACFLSKFLDSNLLPGHQRRNQSPVSCYDRFLQSLIS